MTRKKMVEDIKKDFHGADTIDRLARTFSILGDQTRMRIIMALLKQELCVAELSVLLDMSCSAISHQMRALKDLELVRCRRQGKRAFYALSDDHIENLFEEGLRHVLEKE